jgi:hypothetical protein
LKFKRGRGCEKIVENGERWRQRGSNSLQFPPVFFGRMRNERPLNQSSIELTSGKCRPGALERRGRGQSSLFVVRWTVRSIYDGDVLPCISSLRRLEKAFSTTRQSVPPQRLQRSNCIGFTTAVLVLLMVAQFNVEYMRLCWIKSVYCTALYRTVPLCRVVWDGNDEGEEGKHVISRNWEKPRLFLPCLACMASDA